MIKNIIIVLLLLVCCSCVNATVVHSGYSFDGNGLAEYPNNGTMWVSQYDVLDAPSFYSYTETYETNNNPTYIKAQGSGYVHRTVPLPALMRGYSYGIIQFHQDYTPSTYSLFTSWITYSPWEGSGSYSDIITWGSIRGRVTTDNWYNTANYAFVMVHISSIPIPVYTISGDTDCITGVTLYQNLSGEYRQINYTTTNNPGNYTFEIISSDSAPPDHCVSIPSI